MNWRKKVFENFKLYGVTDFKQVSDISFARIDSAYRAGVDIVQVRAKGLSDDDLFTACLKIRKLANKRRKLFFVNDRLDIALLSKADGIHVGQDDLPIKVIRNLCNKAGVRMLIGKSTHSLSQAIAAEAEGADYIGVGPIFQTPTKPGYQPVGLQLIRQVADKVRIPFVAIGGIDIQNMNQVLGAGAARLAMVRAIFSKNVYANSKGILQQLGSFKGV